MFRFEDPAVLALLLALPLVYWLRWRRGGRVASIRYSAVDAVRAAQTAPVRWAKVVPPALRALALAALVVLVVALYALPAWCVPGITPALRTSFAFTAAARNFALAMVLAAQGFGGPGALAGILVFAVLSTALGFFAASYVGRTRRV